MHFAVYSLKTAIELEVTLAGTGKGSLKSHDQDCMSFQILKDRVSMIKSQLTIKETFALDDPIVLLEIRTKLVTGAGIAQ